MPELPEVETVKRQLKKELIGYTVYSLETDLKKQFRPSFDQVRKAVVGQTIEDVLRRAKLITILLSDNQYLIIHLKMTGSLLIRQVGGPEDRWQHATFGLGKGLKRLELRWIDLRQFGYLQLASEKEKDKIWDSYGPEPLREATADYLKSIFSRRQRPIKLVLIDQKLLAGVGNIYANEALFMAGVHPRTPANKLSLDQIKELSEAIKQVLTASIKKRGTTASDDRYVDAHGRQGGFQQYLKVYGREGEPCPICGVSIEKVKLGGRGTYFCPRCQGEH